MTCSDRAIPATRSASARRRTRSLALLPVALWIAGCQGASCENEAFFGLPSPDGGSIAFVFHRRCAAAHTVTTDVTVLDYHHALRNQPGNVLAVAGEQPVKVSWLGPGTLAVSGFAEPVVRRNARVDAIAIEFRAAGAAVTAPH